MGAGGLFAPRTSLPRIVKGVNMTIRGGRGFVECENCINAELDPLQCRTCEDGSKWEGSGDESEWLTIHEFKDLMTKEMA